MAYFLLNYFFKTNLMAIKPAPYELISVLSVSRGFSRKELPYKLTPYRFKRENGQKFKANRVTMYHNDFRGGFPQFHFTVETNQKLYCRLLLDGETLSWRLIEVKKDGVDLLKLDSDGESIDEVDLPVRVG